MTKLKIALTKGRIEKETIKLLEETGINCNFLKNKNRKLGKFFCLFIQDYLLLNFSNLFLYFFIQ